MKTEVWTLVIWERQGDSLMVFPSEQAARLALTNYIDKKWTSHFGGRPMPRDLEAAAHAYFDASEDESAFLEPHQIDIPVSNLLRQGIKAFVEVLRGASRLELRLWKSMNF